MRDIILRPALNQDRAFIECVYFETQRWIIEELFGWRGDSVEQAKFAEVFDQGHTQIIAADGVDSDWLTVFRDAGRIELDSIYLSSENQGKGIGTEFIGALIKEAAFLGARLSLSAAKINPARRLYERLGFITTLEDVYKVYMEQRP